MQINCKENLKKKNIFFLHCSGHVKILDTADVKLNPKCGIFFFA